MEKRKTSLFRKGIFTNNILLVEKGNDLGDPEITSEVKTVISEDMEIAERFNQFSVNIVPSLNIS